MEIDMWTTIRVINRIGHTVHFHSSRHLRTCTQTNAHVPMHSNQVMHNAPHTITHAWSHLRYTSPVTRKAPKPLRSVSAWGTKEMWWRRMFEMV